MELAAKLARQKYLNGEGDQPCLPPSHIASTPPPILKVVRVECATAASETISSYSRLIENKKQFK
jgi:hypothetical protein